MNVYYPSNNENGLSRLITAAVINHKFRTLLLTDPSQAVEGGYRGECFNLHPEEKKLVLSIRASSLKEFAAQLAIKENGKEMKSNGGRSTRSQ
jgi:hypothetical protein